MRATALACAILIGGSTAALAFEGRVVQKGRRHARRRRRGGDPRARRAACARTRRVASAGRPTRSPRSRCWWSCPAAVRQADPGGDPSGRNADAGAVPHPRGVGDGRRGQRALRGGGAGERRHRRARRGHPQPSTHERRAGGGERGRDGDGLGRPRGRPRRARAGQRPHAHPHRRRARDRRAPRRPQRHLPRPRFARRHRDRARPGLGGLRLRRVRRRRAAPHAARRAGVPAGGPLHGRRRRGHAAAARGPRADPRVRSRRSARAGPLAQLRGLGQPGGRGPQLGGRGPRVPGPLRPRAAAAACSAPGGRATSAATSSGPATTRRPFASSIPRRTPIGSPWAGTARRRARSTGSGPRRSSAPTRSSRTRTASRPPTSARAAWSGPTSARRTSTSGCSARTRSGAVKLDGGVDVNGRFDLEAHDIGIRYDLAGAIASTTDNLSTEDARRTGRRDLPPGGGAGRTRGGAVGRRARRLGDHEERGRLLRRPLGEQRGLLRLRGRDRGIVRRVLGHGPGGARVPRSHAVGPLLPRAHRPRLHHRQPRPGAGAQHAVRRARCATRRRGGGWPCTATTIASTTSSSGSRPRPTSSSSGTAAAHGSAEPRPSCRPPCPGGWGWS